jgi:NAD+ kinase
MAAEIKSLAILGKHDRKEVKDLAEKLILFAAKQNISVVLDEELKPYGFASTVKFRKTSDLCKDADVLFVFGGDGTLLKGAKAALPYGTGVVGVNLGGLGFLTEIAPEELEAVLPEIQKGALPYQERFLIRATLHQNGKKAGSWVVVNDLVIHKGALARIMALSAYCDKNLINHYRADGLIVATPTGSTAYSLSAGGPIVEPGMDALLLTPISAHTLSNRPLLLHQFETLKITIDERNGTVYLTLDGQEGIELNEGDEVIVERVDEKLKLLGSPTKSFFEILRTKLKWGQQFSRAT